MSSTTPALLAAAAGVAFGHAILPDHWAPLAVLGRARRYPLSKIARLSGLAGVAHVLISLILGAVVVVIGLQFRSTFETAQDTVIGSLLIATGIGFVLVELTGHGHHHDHDHVHDHERGPDAHDHRGDHSHDDDPGHDPAHAPDHKHDAIEAHSGVRGIAAVMVPFGAAASPDLTILPVFLAATAAGAATAVGSLVVFGAVTIATIVGLTLAAAAGGYQVRGDWLERWGNIATAAVLIVIGVLVLTGAI